MTTTEVAAPGPALSIVPYLFAKAPYCNTEALNTDAFGTLIDYDPAEVAADDRFFSYLSAAYEDEKADVHEQADSADCGEVCGDQKPQEPTLDLRLPDHLEGMSRHTLVHAVSGLIDAGLSSTDSIPYWDRQAVQVGLEYQHPAEAAERLELVDVLSINALRTWCEFLPKEAIDHQNRASLIERAMRKGRRSKQDMLPQQAERLVHNMTDFRLYTGLFTAKLKHLLWLTDQQPDPQLRWHMIDDIDGYIKQAVDVLGVDPDNLTVDMGVDTGMSADTDRPLYDISMFVQLSHLHKPSQTGHTFALSQALCHKLSLTQLMDSIAREGSEPPFYETDNRYRLPWQFSGSNQ